MEIFPIAAVVCLIAVAAEESVSNDLNLFAVDPTFEGVHSAEDMDRYMEIPLKVIPSVILLALTLRTLSFNIRGKLTNRSQCIVATICLRIHIAYCDILLQVCASRFLHGAFSVLERCETRYQY